MQGKDAQIVGDWSLRETGHRNLKPSTLVELDRLLHTDAKKSLPPYLYSFVELMCMSRKHSHRSLFSEDSRKRWKLGILDECAILQSLRRFS